MPAKHSFNIGEHNDKVLLKHLVSDQRELPLINIEDRINWSYTDSKGQQIKREQVQSRLEYLKKLQTEKYAQFVELCVSKLEEADWSNIQLPDEEAEITKVPSPASSSKRSSEEVYDDITEVPTKKKARFQSPPTMSGANTDFNAALYGLSPESTYYQKYNEDPYMNGELNIFPCQHKIPSDIKGPNGGTQLYSGFFITSKVDLPHLVKNQSEQLVTARLLNPYLLLVTLTKVPYTLLHNRNVFNKSLESPNNDWEFAASVADHWRHSFFIGPQVNVKNIVVDFGNIPLSSKAIFGLSGEENKLKMKLAPHADEVKEMPAGLPLPVTYTAMWQVARVNEKPKIEGGITMQSNLSDAMQLLSGGLNAIVPKDESTLSRSSSSSSLFAASTVSSGDFSDDGSGGTDGTAEVFEKAMECQEEINKEVNRDIKDILKDCDEAHSNKKEKVDSNYDNSHEKGGGGDAVMGSETSHLKRKADDNNESEKEERRSKFKPRDLFSSFTGRK